MQTKPIPRKIEGLNSHEIYMSWTDGSEYKLPYVELRYQCPCAGCVDEHTGQRMIQKNSINPDIKPTGVQPIGRYALQFNWTDGHSTGIYHYDRLLELCQTSGGKI